MEELKKLDQVSLVDQLAEHTERFTRLFFEKKKNDDYYQTKDIIKLLTEELEARKKMK
jgi:hypothetical protein